MTRLSGGRNGRDGTGRDGTGWDGLGWNDKKRTCEERTYARTDTRTHLK